MTGYTTRYSEVLSLMSHLVVYEHTYVATEFVINVTNAKTVIVHATLMIEID